ncbi:MAG: NfeD family protein, partial [Spirochaetales bacterium]
FVVFFFGLGALLTSLLVAVVPPIAGSIPLQVLIWLGFSTVSLFGLRRVFSGWFKGRRFGEGDTREYIGKPAKVIEAITPDHPGRIRFGGTTWVAESYTESFNTGDRVEILARDGMTFIVTDSISGLPPPLDEQSPPEPPDQSAADE